MSIRRTQVSRVSDGTQAPAGYVKVKLEDLGANTESDWCAWVGVYGASGEGIWFPASVGTRCLVAFADDDDELRDPLILGAYFDEVKTAPSTDLGKPKLKRGALQIVLNPDDVCLELNGTTYRLARADKVKDQFDADKTWKDSHTNTTPVTFLGGVFTSSAPLIASPFVSDVSSDKVKVGS